MSEHLPAEVDGERKQLFEKIRHPKKRVFLASFCLSGRVREACKEAEIHFSLHYWWIKHDKAYAAALEAAKQIVADHMEDEVYRRAFQGTNHPVIHKGKITDWYKEYSDLLAMFALKQLRPSYRDSFNVNQFAGPVQLNVNLSANAVNPMAQQTANGGFNGEEKWPIEDKQDDET